MLPLFFVTLSGCQMVWGIDPDVEIVDAVCDATKLDVDPQNCGQCAHDCAGGECSAGVCQPLVLAQASGTPTDIAIDEQYVYWTSDDGKVGRVGKNGGGAQTIISGVAAGLGRIALDQNRVYFRDIEDQSGAASIGAAAKDGSSPVTVATGQPGFGSLASDGNALYWARTDDSTQGAIWRAAFTAGGIEPATIIPGPRLFPQEVAVDAASVFWGENNNGFLEQAAKDGSGSPLELGCGSDHIRAIVLDDDNVYVARADGKVVRTQKGDAATGCSAPSTRELAENANGSPALGLALGGAYIVWTSPELGEVSAIPKTGTCAGTAECTRLLATGLEPTRVAADERAAYWVNQGDRSIAKVAF